jgi:hypothetical protein
MENPNRRTNLQGGRELQSANIDGTIHGPCRWRANGEGASKDGKETTLYFNQAGDHVDAMGKAVKS